MNEKSTTVLEQYGLKVYGSRRARGGIICDTDCGIKILRESNESAKRLEFEYNLLKYIKQNGQIFTDCLIENLEGGMTVADEEGTIYVLRDWHMGRECDAYSDSDINAGARSLAQLHNLLKEYKPEEGSICEQLLPVNLLDIYERHNKELKRAGKFLREKRHKLEFEVTLLESLDKYYEMGKQAFEELSTLQYEKVLMDTCENKIISHGNYNYHSIVFIEEVPGIIGFEQAGLNPHIMDLYYYLRKVMEKQNWNVDTGISIMENYVKIRQISDNEIKLLKVMLSYPEKYWKIVNHYFNTNKAWISIKDIEKLKMINKQEELRREYIKEYL